MAEQAIPVLPERYPDVYEVALFEQALESRLPDLSNQVAEQLVTQLAAEAFHGGTIGSAIFGLIIAGVLLFKRLRSKTDRRP